MGDASVDVVTDETGLTSRYAGGAALNVAVGTRRLGMSSTLVAPIGRDDAGLWLREHLRAYRVGLLEAPGAVSTGIATSVRVAGQPVAS